MASIPPSPSPASAEPMLVPQGDYAGKPPLRLQKSVVVVGANEHCHLHLISSSASRHHALIIHDRDGVYIRDLGSRTKVVVNGQPHRETLLANEDEIHIGKFSFRFSFAAPAADPTPPTPAMRIMVKGGHAPLVTHCRTAMIGNGDGCDISLPGESVSHRHAIIFTAKGKRYVRDLDSRTGTYLDGHKIHQQEVRQGSELRIGEAVITIGEIAQPAEVIETPPPKTDAIPLEAEPEPVAEPPVHSGDTLPLPLEPVKTPPAPQEPADMAEPLKLEPVAETKTDAQEPAPADPEIELSKDSIPVEPEPVQTPTVTEEPIQPADVPEPLKLEPVAETNTDALESALADAEMDMSKDSIPVEPEHLQTPAAIEQPVQPADFPEPLKLEPVSETKSDGLDSAPADAEIDFSHISIPVELEPLQTRAASRNPSNRPMCRNRSNSNPYPRPRQMLWIPRSRTPSSI